MHAFIQSPPGIPFEHSQQSHNATHEKNSRHEYPSRNEWHSPGTSVLPCGPLCKRSSPYPSPPFKKVIIPQFWVDKTFVLIRYFLVDLFLAGKLLIYNPQKGALWALTQREGVGSGIGLLSAAGLKSCSQEEGGLRKGPSPPCPLTFVLFSTL